ncbi:MAG: glycosyltransferase [Bacteroidales bacterium]|nr:glycosyltransferase [Bacteroidales bacterium]
MEKTNKIRIFRLLNRFNLGGPTYNVSILTRSIGEPFETMLVGGVHQVYETHSLHIPHSMGLDPIVLPCLKRSLLPWNDLRALFKLRDMMRDYQPLIFHSHASKAGVLGRIAAYQMGIPIIVHTFHGHVFEAYFNRSISSFFTWIERRLTRISDAIIALSERQKKDLVEKFKIAPEEKVHIIPNGFDLEKFFNCDVQLKRSEIRSQFRLDDDHFVLGWVGRLVPVKNPLMFAEVIYQLVKLGKKIKAFVVGDGMMMKPFELYLNKHAITYSFHTDKDAVVYFLSWQREMTSVLPALDALVLTSDNEGTPVSLIEAQACQIPVITTDVGGIPDIVISEKTALLSPKRNIPAMVKNIITLIENSQLREEMRRYGQEFVKQNFTYELLIQRMRSLYFDLLRKKGIIEI